MPERLVEVSRGKGVKESLTGKFVGVHYERHDFERHLLLHLLLSGHGPNPCPVRTFGGY